MKKLFALLLSFALLFLTACNTKPPVDTTNTDLPNNEVTDLQNDWRELLKDQIVMRNGLKDFIELPSRIVFGTKTDGMVYYYSKADGNAYVYCFDPLCDHTDHTCLANPVRIGSGWSFSNTFFVNNRFYAVTNDGLIYSFAFDGSDKKLEYDFEYELPDTVVTNLWSTTFVYGPYMYITWVADEKGNPHNLRYNTETKEMEDLTEKTGNYISPHYIYNGVIYGMGNARVMGDVYLKADLDLNQIEVNENPAASGYSVNHVIIGTEYEARESIFELPKLIGMRIYDIKTGESLLLTNEALGVSAVEIAGITEEYIYFYDGKDVTLGTTIVNVMGANKEITVRKSNNGKLYRMNHDGTNIICVYDNFEYELNSDMVIYDDKIVMQGQYVAFENGEKKIWGGPIQVATINPDGTIGEFVGVEVLE
jgi:hypothetical protein